MLVKPVPGRTVRDPHSMAVLPEEGREVPDGDPFWLRRLRDDDVTMEQQPARAAQPERAQPERAQERAQPQPQPRHDPAQARPDPAAQQPQADRAKPQPDPARAHKEA